MAEFKTPVEIVEQLRSPSVHSWSELHRLEEAAANLIEAQARRIEELAHGLRVAREAFKDFDDYQGAIDAIAAIDALLSTAATPQSDEPDEREADGDDWFHDSDMEDRS